MNLSLIFEIVIFFHHGGSFSREILQRNLSNNKYLFKWYLKSIFLIVFNNIYTLYSRSYQASCWLHFAGENCKLLYDNLMRFIAKMHITMWQSIIRLNWWIWKYHSNLYLSNYNLTISYASYIVSLTSLSSNKIYPQNMKSFFPDRS